MTHDPYGLGKALCDALGLTHVTRLVLTMEVNCCPTVEATIILVDGRTVEEAVRRFHLHPVPVEQSQQSGDVQERPAEQPGDMDI